MNSAWQKNRRREIKNTLGRYLAILAIIALGVGFFGGLKVTKAAMIYTGDVYVNTCNLYDFRLISTLGLTDGDAAYFSRMGGVQYAQGAVSQDFFATVGSGSEQALSAHSITDKINILSLTAGRMPARADECVADGLIFTPEDIGKAITVADANDKDTLDKFSYKQYTVVGIANSVTYLNRERGTTKLAGGTVSGFVYIPRDGFTTDYYTEVYLTLKTKYYLFSPEYDDAVSAYKQSITDALLMRADERYQKLVADADAGIADAQAKYDSSLADYNSQKADADQKFSDAKKKLDDAAKEIRKNESKLADSKKQVAQSQKEYNSGLADYNDNLAHYSWTTTDSEEQLNSAQSQIDANRAAAQSGIKQIEDSGVITQYNQLKATAAALQAQIAGMSPLDPAYAVLAGQLGAAQAALKQIEQSGVPAQYQSLQSALGQLDAAQKELDAKKAQVKDQTQDAWSRLAQAKNKLDTSLKQLNDAKEQIAEGQSQLADAKAEYAKNLADYESQKADANQKLADAQQDLSDAKVKIDDAKTKIADIKQPDTYTLDRTVNTGYASFQNDSSVVEGIGKVFPIFFFLVAALVCSTTMTRMVEEQRTQIGTLKALGYGNAAIVWKYAWYSGSAAVIGCVLGFLGGTILFPWAIWRAYGMLYNFSAIRYVFDWSLAAVSIAASLLCSVGATFIACRAELLQMPAELMRPRAPKAGKRILLEKITFFWKRMSFLRKVSIRNIVRYKKRLFMMILGIAGCTALMLTGLGIRDSISNIANDQFGSIWKYDYVLTFTDAKDPAQINSFVSDTSSILSQCVFVCSESMDVVCPDGPKSVNVIATDDPHITDLVYLHNSNKAVPYPPAGSVVITKKLSRLSGVSPGGQITVKMDEGNTRTFKVSGVCDNYVYNYMYMTGQTYEAAFGKTCTYKSALAGAGSTDVHGIAAKLMNGYNTAGVSVMQDMRSRVDNMMKSLNSIVVLVISCAGALAFVVLFNLSNINITERAREIATIKVLGFYPSEVRSYVFRENIVLTAIGAIAGLPFGVWLHSFVMSQIQIDFVDFHVQILPLSYALALVMTFAFTFLVDLMMQPKLNKIDMVDSLKSVE